MFKIRGLFILGLFLGLFACSTGGSFVVSKRTLDPMTIYSYTPLVLPPVYYISSQEISDERRFLKQNRNDIETILFGQVGMSNNKISNKSSDDVVLGKTSNFNKSILTKSELNLLKLAGADVDFYDIREKLNKETSGMVKKQDGFLSKIFSNNKGEALDYKLSQYRKLNQK